jgi:hypothetical protein
VWRVEVVAGLVASGKAMACLRLENLVVGDDLYVGYITATLIEDLHLLLIVGFRTEDDGKPPSEARRR